MPPSNKENHIKLDLHIHSHYSEDAKGSPKDIVKVLQKKGLQGMSITDHNSIKGSLEAKKLKIKNFIIIPGLEISTTDGHFIALGVEENIPSGFSIEETVDKILDIGGVAIAPHVFRKMSGIKEKKLEIIHQKIPAMEVFNSCSLPKTNKKTAKLAKKLNLGGTGGSDAHNPLHVGYGHTLIDSSNMSVDTILSEILKKKTWGNGMTLPLDIRRKRMLKSIKQYFERGFKRI